MVVYDEGQPPCVLLQKIGPEDAFATAVAANSGRVGYLDQLGSVRWASWDAVISLGRPDLPKSFDRDLRIIQIGGMPLGEVLVDETGYSGVGGMPVSFRRPVPLFVDDAVHGVELVLPDGLEADWRELSKTVLVPLIRSIPLPRRGFRVRAGFDESPAYVQPLLQDRDGRVLAMRYRPPIGPVDSLYLPDGIDDLAPWISAAFKSWSTHEPKRFPAEPKWKSESMWMTPQELEAHTQLDRQRATMERAVIEMEQQIALAKSHLGVQSAAADEGPRVLLTGTGAPLVVAVRDALARLGFTVRDMDAEGGREKLEDLRVLDGEWSAICEVKGYGGGASTTDLMKIGRFEALFAKETGELPDAKWYVANTFRGRDPGSRMPILKGQDNTVDSFAEQNGLALDTRELFQLDKSVTLGLIAHDTARRMLRDARGRFEFKV